MNFLAPNNTRVSRCYLIRQTVTTYFPGSNDEQTRNNFRTSMSQPSPGKIMSFHSMNIKVPDFLGQIEEYRGISTPNISSTLITVTNNGGPERIWQEPSASQSPEVQSLDQQSTLSVADSDFCEPSGEVSASQRNPPRECKCLK